MHLASVEHALTYSSERANYAWAGGMCTVSHAPRHILDESTARRIEEERQRECPAHEGTLLHLVPKDIDMFDQEVLSFWMTAEASANVVARAVVVPSGLTALRHHIRWVFFSSDIPFRVFRNSQVAKGWLIDCWLHHQEELRGLLKYSVYLEHHNLLRFDKISKKAWGRFLLPLKLYLLLRSYNHQQS